MKAQMEVLLSMWGRWAIRRASGALGYPSVSPMFRGAPRGDSYGSALPLGLCDDDMMAVDAAVNKMPEIIKITVIAVYQPHGNRRTMRDVAIYLGVSEPTIRKYVTESHRLLSDQMGGCSQEYATSDRFHSCVQTTKPASA